MNSELLALVLALSGLILAFISWSIWRLISTSAQTDVDMLYALTHDMSNPLQEVLATLANMKTYAPANAVQLQQDIDSIHVATSYLAELTANAKSLSLLDSPDTFGQSRLVDMTGIAQTVIIQIDNHAARENVRLTYQGSDTSPKIWGNGSDLERVLYNLVHNGIKYRNPEREQCEVIITIRGAERGRRQMLVVEVEDNGIGMSATRLATIWDQPFQPRDVRTIGIHGTGFGLYLAKRIIDKYHGTVEVDSEIGRGTQFIIYFPQARES